MAVIEGGVSAALMGVGAEAAVAAHFTAKPIAHGSLGHYQVARRFALINAQAANAILVAFRNTSANPAVLMRLRMFLLQTTAPTAAIEVRLSATAARSYSASDATNSTALTLTGNNAKKRSTMGTSGVEIRETTVAAGATGGTKTLDADKFATLAMWETAVVPTAGPVPDALYEYKPSLGDGGHPFVFANNEGFIVMNDAVLGAAAAGILYYEIDWAEVAAF